MNARDCPCFGIKCGGALAPFIVVLDSKGSALNIRYRLDVDGAKRVRLTVMLTGGTPAARRLKRAQVPLIAWVGGKENERTA